MFTIQQFANSNRLPTLPEVALKMVEIAKQEDPDFGEIARIIRSDPVVGGKILKTANSPLFAFRQKIETIEQAIPKLGISLLRTLILSFYLASHKSKQDELEPVLQTLWRSSLTQAVFAELIAEEIGSDPASAFLAAMVQDIGILAMISEAPQQYLESVLTRAAFPNVASAERSEFGFNHVDVSVEIVSQWGLSDRFGRAIKIHHAQIVGATSKKGDRLGTVLIAANLGTTVLFSTRSSAMSLGASLDRWTGFIELHFGLTAVTAEEIMSEVNRRVAEYSLLFNFNIGAGVSATEVVAEAKQMLQEIALKNQMDNISAHRRSPAPKEEDDELYRDSLCGLFNRRYMDEHLSDRIGQRIKNRKPIALLFLDVDKFKSINDKFGHAAGDKAIQHVADWLTSSIRVDDFAIRIGGDEFLIILQSVKESQFEKIATRIAKNVPPLELSQEEFVDISLSVGCTIYQPVRGDTADTNWLIEQADQSMYRAKKAGGDSISFQKFVGQTTTAVS